jgi:5'-3' exonuclease
MGIKYLNNICKKYCKDSYTNINLHELKYKTIVIDTNVYMYQFKKTNTLEVDFEIMCQKLIKYNITPMFIFDGNVPKDKLDFVEKRKHIRKTAESKLQILSTKTLSNKNKHKIKHYENQTIKLNRTDFLIVKNLFHKYKLSYITAINEADELCALMNKLHNYPVMSEDMDLFVYGTTTIIKNPNFYKETIDFYNTKSIINTLNILSINHFQSICILAGTDYYSNNNFNIYIAICLYIMYIETNKNFNYSLIDWCLSNNIISYDEFYIYKHIYNKFNFSNLKLLQ